ncbi:MAG TPA: RNA polymerase sigma factor [Amaricoccus sp.]|nr:RNA polymerase sigma factor [Amaricoccus sp.]
MHLAVRMPLDHAALDDMALVELARRHDEAAVRTLVQRHNRRLFRVARGVLRDDAEAEDVVQATYVRAFTRLDGFRGEAALVTWLTRIALNEALGRLRRRRPRADLAALDAEVASGGGLIVFPMSPAPPGPESEAGRAQIRAILERAVDALPEPFRLVFVLREIEGLSTEEAATLLAIRPETAKTRLHRARRLLRLSIERSLSAGFDAVFPFDGARCVHMADRVVERLREHRAGRREP